MRDTCIVGLIPARYASSRLPGKPLASIAGKPMIQRVYERCLASMVLQSVCVATDDERIADAVERFGGRVVMTRPDHPSGTDRVAEAAQKIEADIIVNIQGDQPFMAAAMIDEAVAPLVNDTAVDVSTLMFPIVNQDDLCDPGVVKVVTDLTGKALYFSRSLVPYPREPVPHNVFEHVGLYVYRKETLLRLTRLPATTLEKVESLEQLRWLEHGLRIQVTESTVQDKEYHGFSVDTREDVKRAEQMLHERE
ncbi:MAG TPA: 3-deoxy-manno-octulosonate cytidylyltransferase [Candidatus Hydrogenedentes bacterium]|jgi:3-deoxy-manno-octulosonate cytidylyltransferase (CMP-KDO synthetase)|nr:MAG: 3-deoxy-manno-octulosonate cytidylyltransferase [Candidatus Hydrogenedentes bacterium ADurb.Bin179]HQM99870.1 3-deoxy-manno-octulosonate cytidylyltransferase [Candidatus Hydrogenedentota bacterium]